MKSDVERILTGLYPNDVVVAAAAVRTQSAARSYRAGAARSAEFAAGRQCARRVLAGMGLEDTMVGLEADGAPAWPPGIVGALSHSGGLAAAAGARCDALAGIGLDLMPVRPLLPDHAALFCVPSELRWLSRRSNCDRPLLTLVLFAAKESVQKCARPIIGRLPDPHGVELHMEPWERRLEAHVQGSSGIDWSGRYASEGGYLFVASWARRRI